MTRGTPERGILDTSAVIGLGDLNESLLPRECLISAVTLAELSVGPLVAATDRERAARQAHLQQAEADFEPLPFDSACARAFGQVAASLRQSGRKPKARAYDALIAATAIANTLPLYTLNPSDFQNIEGLDVHAIFDGQVPYPQGPEAHQATNRDPDGNNPAQR